MEKKIDEKEQKVKLMLAKKTREYSDIIEALDCGVDMNKLNPNADSNYLGYKMPLISAFASSSELALLESAVQNGGDVNIKDDKGITPLMYAVEPIQGAVSKEVVEFLVENGADVKARRKTEYGDESVLTRATAFASPEVIRYLIEKGAGKTLRLSDIRDYQKTIHPGDLKLYDQVQSVGPAFRSTKMSPYLVAKIERYKAICAILTDAYANKQKNAKMACVKEEPVAEI